MARSIGSINFDLFRGRVAGLKTRVETWEVFGLDGYGVWDGAVGDSEFELETVFFAQNPTESNAHVLDCENVQGDILPVVDAFGRTFSECLIEHVDIANCEQPCIWQEHTNAVMVTIKWRLKRVA